MHDTVRITLRPARPGRDWAFRVQAGRLPRDLANLAGRAAQAFAQAAGGRKGVAPAEVSVVITKRIPVAAGLGGGSSDAAAVLRALQAHYGSPLTPDELVAAAAAVGSDVPFFLHGGRAVGRSRGELLAPLPAGPPLPLLLGLPTFPLRTADVYREFDRLAAGSAPSLWDRREADVAGLAAALAAGDPARAASGAAPYLRNDLEPAAVSLRPEVGLAVRALRAAGCLAALVSGSGPSVFGLAPDPGADPQAAAGIARRAAGILEASAPGSYRFLPLEGPPR